MRITEPQLGNLAKRVPVSKLPLFKALRLMKASVVDGLQTVTVWPRFDMELRVHSAPDKKGNPAFHSLEFWIRSLGKKWTLTAKEAKSLKEKSSKAWLSSMALAASTAKLEKEGTQDGKKPV